MVGQRDVDTCLLIELRREVATTRMCFDQGVAAVLAQCDEFERTVAATEATLEELRLQQQRLSQATARLSELVEKRLRGGEMP